MQGILQGFRVVGPGSKLGREYPVTAYRLSGRVTLEKLLGFIPDSNRGRQQFMGLMRKGRLSLAEAKEKYPDWHERRRPEGRKADCHRDTGLDPKTIHKWRDSESEI